MAPGVRLRFSVLPDPFGGSCSADCSWRFPGRTAALECGLCAECAPAAASRARARRDGGPPHSGLAALSWRRPVARRLPGHHRAQQRLAVDRIGLGAPVASGHSNRRRIDDVALNAIGLEQAMSPETIEPDFLD